MLDPNRPLLGLTVGLSAAQSEDATDPGFHNDELNRSVIRIAQRLLAAGTRIVVGHDWRKSGIMEALLNSSAIEHAASLGKPGKWAIHNLIPEALEAAHASAEMEEYSEAGILHTESVGLPNWWNSIATALPPDYLETARTAVGIMNLRERMEKLCSARVCIGGKIRGFSGFYPGILEEGWRTARSGKPLYVTALLGGASLWLAQASGWRTETRPGDFPSNFRPASRCAATHELLVSILTEDQRRLLPEPDLLPVLSADSLITRAGLNKEDWNLMVEAPTADAVGVMVIRGLANVNRGL